MSESSKKEKESSEAVPGVPLDCHGANADVWLVKVPKYLAKKWNEAPDGSEVGKIRITGSKTEKREVVFLLNESLGQSVIINIGNKTLEEKIPLEHKFVTMPLDRQDVYILKQSEEGTKDNKESLAVIGKVKKRAECTPIRTDLSYIQLKRETMKKFIEPVRQIKMADKFVQRTTFLPRTIHPIHEKKEKAKRLRDEKDKVLDQLFSAFSKHQYYNIKSLEKLTKQPTSYLKEILHEICRYNAKGAHKNTWELKDEYKQAGTSTEAKKSVAAANIAEKSKDKDKEKEKDEDFMDEDEEDDLDDSDSDDENDDLIETL